jgi:hypothetical protein
MAANIGHVPVDFTTDIGKTRLLIQDTDATDITGTDPNQTGTYLWISDDEITAFLSLGLSPAKVAIRVLRMVAMTPAMQLKKWSSADLSVDGAAITRALRELIADIEEADAAGDVEAASEFIKIVSVGPAMGQPALFPQHPLTIRDVPLDPTLPLVI